MLRGLVFLDLDLCILLSEDVRSGNWRVCRIVFAVGLCVVDSVGLCGGLCWSVVDLLWMVVHCAWLCWTAMDCGRLVDWSRNVVDYGGLFTSL